MKSLFDSLVRTYVPWLVGVIVGWLVSLGIPLDPEVEVQLTLVLVTAAAFLYYFLARIFELYVSPKLGWLVGLPKQPLYVKTPEPATTVRHLTVDELPSDGPHGSI